MNNVIFERILNYFTYDDENVNKEDIVMIKVQRKGLF